MKCTILILIVGLVAFSLARDNINENFSSLLKGEDIASDYQIMKIYQEFLYKYKNSIFDSARDMDRFVTFKANVKSIIAHNSNPRRTFDRGVNHLSDMTAEEKMRYYNVMEPQECSATASPRNTYNADIPTNFSWTDSDMVSPVKDQKSCGSCWTFSTTGAMESHLKISSGDEELLSEQELVSCPDEDLYDTHGCSGGLPSYAFNFIRDYGLETENNYPYVARDAPCTFNASAELITTDGPFNITAGDEQQLMEELFNNGPVSVAFQVVEDFMDYTSGVYSSTVCKNTQMDVNHAVLAVGFGTTADGVDYWLVKNSWSDVWGDEGYFKIQRGANMCGIAMCNSYPLNVRRA